MNLHEHERFLWGLCYRMTGSAADADDLVQDTFTRALERPPRDLSAALRPWLTRVAVNLARDALRRRRRSPYVGPWLPEPLETADEVSPLEPVDTAGRYDLLESVSYAFLLALEKLSPKQRAVLLLRDVFDYSVREAAEAVGASEANVKQLHLRARRAMAPYHQQRAVPTRAMQQRNLDALNTFVGAMVAGDVAQVEALLAPQVTGVTDGGGRYHAALNVLHGPQRVTKFLLGVNSKRGAPIDVEVRQLNGFPALVARYDNSRDPKLAPLVMVRIDLGPDGKIVSVHSVLAPTKLAAFPRRAA